ncbi:hypothetical protein LP414_27540 [Polaromonas sp. P1(28)-13]|nr:hypothetical protein LP414_27540 [Polaromonas sp. P1(28)-13]
MFSSGVCKALDVHHEGIDTCGRDAYGEIDGLLNLTENLWLENGCCWLPGFMHGWAGDRAFMCLLMAEWLETDFLP